MAASIAGPSPSLVGLTPGQVVQMRDHLAQKYYWWFGEHIPFTVLREAGQGAITATLGAPLVLFTHADTLPTRLYHNIKVAVVATGRAQHDARSTHAATHQG